MGIRNLIDFLPYYFKAKDTYKDSSGKGILEKFLDVCGDYFTDNLHTVIGETLDILDLEATTEYYLSYLWEILGQLPFANQREVKPFELTEAQQRALIKYGNAFLKIRGTKEFFEVVARVYGWNISISVDDNGWEKDLIRNSEVKYPYLDAEVFDDENIAFDEYHRMKQCVNATFTITGTFTDTVGAQKALKAFVEKYVPFNVHPKVVVNGVSLETVLSILIEKWTDKGWVKANSEERLESTLRFRVSMVDTEGNKYDDVNFYSSVSSSTSRVLRTSPYEFTVTNVKNASGDTYQFITLDNMVTSLKITTEAVTVDSFSITCSPTEATLPLNGGKTSTVVTGTINGNPAQVYCLETGETKASGSTWQFDEAGFYNFCLVANGTVRTSFRVKAASYHYKVEVVEANSGQYVTDLTKITGSLNNTRFIARVTCTKPDVDSSTLKFKIEGTSLVYQSGTTFRVPAYGTYILKPYVYMEGNENATLTVTSSNLNFNTFIVAREANPSIISNDKATTYADIQTQPRNTASAQLMSSGLAWQVQVPGSDEVINVPYQGTVSGDYGTIQSTSVNTIRITSKVGGTYKAWPSAYPSGSVSWNVQDTRESQITPSKLIIVPKPKTSAWSGGNTDNATYQLSETDVEAKYVFQLVDNEGRSVTNNITVLEDGTPVNFSNTAPVVKTDKGTYIYTTTYGGRTFTATLQVKDFQLEVKLSCTPSSSAFQGGQASTKLAISANKSVALSIKESDSGDLYSNGDTFIAYEEKEYTFIAMVDGQEFVDASGNKVTAKFKVTDLTAVTVEPDVIEWEADETDERQITITAPSDSTEWVIIQS